LFLLPILPVSTITCITSFYFQAQIIIQSIFLAFCTISRIYCQIRIFVIVLTKVGNKQNVLIIDMLSAFLYVSNPLLRLSTITHQPQNLVTDSSPVGLISIALS